MKESVAKTSWVFMLDGDNTLWDTNMVFTRAQLAVLRELQKTNVHFTEKRGFVILRQVDDRLIFYYHRREYDFRALFLALYFHFKGNTQDDSVRMATRILRVGIPPKLGKIIKPCGEVFREEMQKLPPLFSGVKSTLRAFRRMGSVVILFSEGNTSRVLRLVRALSLEKYFDAIFVRKKTYALYARARQQALSRLIPSRSRVKVIVVGDLLDPDVKIGNGIGAITVLRLGGYKPNQHPKDRSEKPKYVIRKIPELLSIVEREDRSAS